MQSPSDGEKGGAASLPHHLTRQGACSTPRLLVKARVPKPMEVTCGMTHVSLTRGFHPPITPQLPAAECYSITPFTRPSQTVSQPEGIIYPRCAPRRNVPF